MSDQPEPLQECPFQHAGEDEHSLNLVEWLAGCVWIECTCGACGPDASTAEAARAAWSCRVPQANTGEATATVPCSFTAGLADVKAGRTVPMEQALTESPWESWEVVRPIGRQKWPMIRTAKLHQYVAQIGGVDDPVHGPSVEVSIAYARHIVRCVNTQAAHPTCETCGRKNSDNWCSVARTYVGDAHYCASHTELEKADGLGTHSQSTASREQIH